MLCDPNKPSKRCAPRERRPARLWWVTSSSSRVIDIWLLSGPLEGLYEGLSWERGSCSDSRAAEMNRSEQLPPKIHPPALSCEPENDVTDVAACSNSPLFAPLDPLLAAQG